MTNQVWNSDTAESGSGSGFGSGENGEWWVGVKPEVPRHGPKALDRSDMPTSDPEPVTLSSLMADGLCESLGNLEDEPVTLSRLCQLTNLSLCHRNRFGGKAALFQGLWNRGKAPSSLALCRRTPKRVGLIYAQGRDRGLEILTARVGRSFYRDVDKARTG